WRLIVTIAVMVIGAAMCRAHLKRYGKHKDSHQYAEDDPNTKHKIKPVGPWQFFFYQTLPLRAMSRLWGQCNDIELPVWLREPVFRFYSYLFGVNLDEMADPDLTHYKNLGEFFYREIRPELRPIDDADIVSPADGTILHVGIIDGGQVEQVKGMTYSVDALLGPDIKAPSRAIKSFPHNPNDIDVIERDKNFAILNGITYTLDDLIGNDNAAENQNAQSQIDTVGDKSAISPSSSASAAVAKAMSSGYTVSSADKELFFVVIYLAPGDYHRFHSPANWVVTTRRHFTGELFSVSPYLQDRLEGLLALNERVALLGRWRHGFFSMTPVGATNVGSIKINFDQDLRTNTYYERVHSNQEPATGKPRKSKKNMMYEASYKAASRMLGGYPCTRGAQIGGFNLGSTIVLIFEAPKTFNFCVKNGQKIKVGEKLGDMS
ncbi:hypothetical protein CANCADRAFT_18623, partial [Tortispora caseinolytica NRRL Y-17796]